MEVPRSPVKADDASLYTRISKETGLKVQHPSPRFEVKTKAGRNKPSASIESSATRFRRRLHCRASIRATKTLNRRPETPRLVRRERARKEDSGKPVCRGLTARTAKKQNLQSGQGRSQGGFSQRPCSYGVDMGGRDLVTHSEEGSQRATSEFSYSATNKRLAPLKMNRRGLTRPDSRSRL